MWTPWIASPAHPTPWAPPVSGPRRWIIDALLRISALLVRTAVRVQRAPLLAPVPPVAPRGRPAAPDEAGAMADRARQPARDAEARAPSHAQSHAQSHAHAHAYARQAAPSAAVANGSASAEREFHAEAGAPEGALYVDGQFIGWLSGVTRL